MSSSPPSPAGLVSFSVVVAVLRRPDLWMTTLQTIRQHATRGWWRRPPFVPLPDAAWIHFRLETAYGGDGTTPIAADELITWLEWQATAPV